VTVPVTVLLLADQGRCFFAKITQVRQIFFLPTRARRCDVVQWQ
jgi:hypothetical protein